MLFDHDFVGARCSFHVVARAEVAESGRLGRAELLAKRGSIGQMQTPAELVPIPESSVKALESFGAAFWKNPEKNWSNLAEFQQNLGKIRAKFAKFWKKTANISNF